MRDEGLTVGWPVGVCCRPSHLALALALLQSITRQLPGRKGQWLTKEGATNWTGLAQKRYRGTCFHSILSLTVAALHCAHSKMIPPLQQAHTPTNMYPIRVPVTHLLQLISPRRILTMTVSQSSYHQTRQQHNVRD